MYNVDKKQSPSLDTILIHFHLPFSFSGIIDTEHIMAIIVWVCE